MATLTYDEKQLLGQLERLPAQHRAAFAAACAERLLPAYTAFSARTGRGDPATLTRLLERLWADLAGDQMTDNEVEVEIDTCMPLIPQEDDGPWVAEQALAEDAASAVAYALRCRQSGESQEAVSAAHSTYSALDYFLVDRYDPPDGKVHGLTHPEVQAELLRVLADPLMQVELSHQRRDLDELLAAGEREGPMVIARLRDRARDDAKSVFPW
jgi:hypothetical protein